MKVTDRNKVSASRYKLQVKEIMYLVTGDIGRYKYATLNTYFPFIPLFCRRNLMNIGMDPTKNINIIAKQKRHKVFS